MSLKYVEEKLFAAAEALALDERSVRERLLHAYRDSVSIIRLSLRAARLSSGGFWPGAYLPVSTPRAIGEYETTPIP